MRATLAECRWRLGWLLFSASRYDEALSLYRLACADLEALAAAPGATAELRRSLADTVSLIGSLLDDTGKTSEAEAELRQNLAFCQKLADDNPTVPDYRADVALALENLGDVARMLGRETEARDDYERTIALHERLVAEHPARTLYRSHLAWSFRGRGLARLAMGDPAGAAADARRRSSCSKSFRRGRARTGGRRPAATRCSLVWPASTARRCRPPRGTPRPTGRWRCLRKAVGMGYRDAAFRTESTLDPLRQREDFKELLAELEKPSPATPEIKP